ncbi:hypothetical protein AXF42_Ash009289 [Apostasia shenzhenica]|uniref:GrpE protein homolog n=1 Tax=Apostasia shenzhenica TaxID=1088818 RepID=A0A2I0B3N4_9ASPA|nr:hypothetical protein AXF42_Ash009289 [Apostasia shenzhenica]
MASKVLSRILNTNPQHLLVRDSSWPHLIRGIPMIGEYASRSSKLLPSQTSQLGNSYLMRSIFQRSWFSSCASPQATEKDINQLREDDDTSKKIPEASQGTMEARVSESSELSGDSKPPNQPEDAEPELSVEQLVKLVAEKDELLKTKQEAIAKMQDKVLRTYAEMENVLQRTKREVDNSKKYGIQNFAKCLLDVADNLGRASNVVNANFSKIDQTDDSVGVSLLKSLLKGVEMTDKQLAEVFRKFEIVKYDPVNEKFDPNRHNAIYEITDASKPPGTVATVLKSGYMLHDRIIRPAEVGVTKSSNGDAGSSSQA